ncbi:adenine nucleotide alpha hydrolases-like protein [Pseudovirgaria hyperparasitica]|uniref:Adenine nucleotide alpha hydrolases-like protein n=1 Tax=Pseudovirgaria hyperparasitica TaxID=470096 RepID=A0A6A6WJ31_9PEZI|nr:adenine nucleotide alpha hydrolases-like protein [Pseudovirgaria hyperparasitica]KAF2761271.1 adenine nucleotide alpha hydrolases-like protein [Pseudovirgaria hyperparasitica]
MQPSPSPSPTSAASKKDSPSSGSSSTIRASSRPTALKFAEPVVQKQNVESRTPKVSLQFQAHSKSRPSTGSPKSSVGEKRRMSSPPPPPVFRPRVSFDTFDKPADFIEENSFTLVSKHKDYAYTKRSRTFLCGIDSNDYSEYALEWLIDELVDDGDEIVCLRVVDKDASIADEKAIEKGRYQDEARTMMKRVQAKNHESKAINVVLEFAVGKVNKVIDEMINLYEPAILVVGTRGRSLAGFQGLLPGSVSKYCLQHSPVPVIVVRPNSKRAKAKRKRHDDPTRRGYRDILDKSGPEGGHMIDFDVQNPIFDESQPASEDEAAAVAEANAYKESPERHPLAQLVTPASLAKVAAEAEAEAGTPPGASRIMKSPSLGTLESPLLSSEDSEDEDQGGVSIEAHPEKVALSEDTRPATTADSIPEETELPSRPKVTFGEPPEKK